MKISIGDKVTFKYGNGATGFGTVVDTDKVDFAGDGELTEVALVERETPFPELDPEGERFEIVAFDELTKL